MKILFTLTLLSLTLLVGCTSDSSGPTQPQTTTTTTAAPAPDLVVQKQVIDFLENTLTRVTVGTDFLYYIEVTNQGNADAVGVQILDVIPEGLRIGFLEYTERSGFDCSRRSRTVECTLARLEPGQTFKLYIELRTELASIRIENVVVVNPGNITATAVLEVL